MADEDKKLMTSRLTNASQGSYIDNSIADLEAALRLIFGVTADTVMSNAMTISAAGNVTMVGDLTLAGAPTDAAHAATKAYVDALSGAEPDFVVCKVTKSGGQTVSNNSITTLTWDSEVIDPDGCHSTVTNTERLTVPAAQGGYYYVMSHFQWSANPGAGSYTEVRIYKNGGLVYSQQHDHEATGSISLVSGTMLGLAAGDYVTCAAYQNSGSSKTTHAGEAYISFSMFKIKTA
jgi:hypothetical protein